MNNEITNERQAFEAACPELGWMNLTTESSGWYVCSDTRHAWEVWLARAVLATEREQSPAVVTDDFNTWWENHCIGRGVNQSMKGLAIQSWLASKAASPLLQSPAVDHIDAKLGAVVWKFIDRMTDVAPPDDSAERILAEFVAAVDPLIRASCNTALPLQSPAVAPMLVPDGWKLVPCIATGSMMNEGSSYINTHMQDVWKSMLAAAPTPGESHE